MARLTVGLKTRRLLTFLMGLGNPQIVRALQPYGFDQAALDEGWALLRRTAASHLDAPRPQRVTRAQIERLDEWENHWFPIASAVLQRHHPEVHTRVFHNLKQTEGQQVVISVGTFVERVDALVAAGETEPVATLARHGLTEAVLAQARTMLAELMQPPFEDPPADGEPVVDPEAENAMWSYYLQWSAIARRAISERRLLRMLGFRRSSRGGIEDTVPGDDAPADTPPAPGDAPTQ